jgi:MFS family permease
MAAGGLVLAITGGFTLHLVPGKLLLVISSLGYIISVLLFAIMPNDANYWAYVFPAMLCATVGVDITYTVSNVFITTSLPRHRQGLAGALINSVLFLGISFFLGLADLIVAKTAKMGPRKSYKVAFWFALGCAAFALFLLVIFVKIGKAKSDLTIEEKVELEAKISSRVLNTQHSTLPET